MRVNVGMRVLVAVRLLVAVRERVRVCVATRFTAVLVLRAAGLFVAVAVAARVDVCVADATIALVATRVDVRVNTTTARVFVGTAVLVLGIGVCDGVKRLMGVSVGVYVLLGVNVRVGVVDAVRDGRGVLVDVVVCVNVRLGVNVRDGTRDGVYERNGTDVGFPSLSRCMPAMRNMPPSVPSAYMTSGAGAPASIATSAAYGNSKPLHTRTGCAPVRGCTLLGSALLATSTRTPAACCPRVSNAIGVPI
jgi:hypothetical protein